MTGIRIFERKKMRSRCAPLKSRKICKTNAQHSLIFYKQYIRFFREYQHLVVQVSSTYQIKKKTPEGVFFCCLKLPKWYRLKVKTAILYRLLPSPAHARCRVNVFGYELSHVRVRVAVTAIHRVGATEGTVYLYLGAAVIDVPILPDGTWANIASLRHEMPQHHFGAQRRNIISRHSRWHH